MKPAAFFLDPNHVRKARGRERGADSQCERTGVAGQISHTVPPFIETARAVIISLSVSGGCVENPFRCFS